MAASNLVIKVKFGETLRRFNARVVDGDMDFDMNGLREKVASLFSFSPDTELNLSYVDEDGDMVALVDDEDLHDVVKQSLNPVRIHVKLDSGKNSRPFGRSSESPTPLRSPRVQQTSDSLENNLTTLLQSVEAEKEKLQAAVMKLTTDLASKASTSAPAELVKILTDFASKVSTSDVGFPEIVSNVSKLMRANREQLSDSHTKVQPSAQIDVPESSTVATGTADSGKSAVPETSTVAKGNTDRGICAVLDPSTSKVPTNGKSDEKLLKRNETLSIPQPDATMEKNEPRFLKLKKGVSSKTPEFDGSSFAAAVGKKEKVKKERLKKLLSECYANENSRIKSSHQPPHAANGLFVGKFNEFRNSSIDLPSAANNASAGPEPQPGPKHSEGSSWGVNASGTWGLPHPSGLNFIPPLPQYPSGVRFVPPPGSMNECPFSRTTYAVPTPFPSRKSTVHNDGSEIVFHRGVRCDGCGVHPITGPRFKSKVKMDYDLCSICFSRMGNELDYMRMDRPALYHPHMPFKGPHGAISATAIPQVCKGLKAKLGPSKFDSRFIQDINIIDGTALAPLTPFTKIWRMRNNGTVVWPQKTQLRWIGGDKLSSQTSVEVEIPAAGLPVEAELDVAVDFVAPELPGRYISYWRMAAPSGQKFGQRVWVLIQVDPSIQNTSSEIGRGFNLNLPPLTPAAPEIINLDTAPIVEDSHPAADSSKKTVESVEPVVNMEQPLQPNLENELKFPINDSLLINSGAMNSVPSASSSVSYPIIDLTPVAAPEFPSLVDPQPTFVVNSEAAPGYLPGTLEAEEALLRELKDMGFTQVNLNREVLRRNGYNLEQTVDVLCGVADWDPILEELQEMGFNDTEVNKKLLEKNNGSIKRVVMDLIAGERM